MLVFPTDINLDTSVYSGNYYSFNYFYSFIKACLFIASHYPKINFFCKLKDLEHINLFNKNDKLINLNINKYPNFKLVSNPRMEYINLLIKSDLAICIGFTSPGIDSILLGKKTLYYSKLFNAGDALKEIPYLVNNSKKELLSSFKNLVKKNNNFQLLYSKKIDPYNDGKAIKRIVKYITKNN